MKTHFFFAIVLALVLSNVAKGQTLNDEITKQVNEKLIEASRNWGTDKYKAGSAVLTDAKEQGDILKCTGNYRLYNWAGSEIKWQFTAEAKNLLGKVTVLKVCWKSHYQDQIRCQD